MYLMELHCDTRACEFVFFFFIVKLLCYAEVVTFIHAWTGSHGSMRCKGNKKQSPGVEQLMT